MKHRATSRFWTYYRKLPEEIQQLADRGYQLLLKDSRHPSLRFKKVGKYWSVRVGAHYRAVALDDGDEMVWIWIGPHAEYDSYLQHR